ncbi:CBS domain-containing protein [Haloplanus aerogenes]|uniref:CBS domain-containing protein n=1 Tax=Haloplanus aerogenes TaxID=660522 RepID=A0A3M0DSQ5_9EURY|nr:CBS domain-containing protein [Haloplanus aerogenes]AZH25369.1 CBS domain-containing protein [Haloplanus aerogenes]RMB25071.1 CBS domain-containing protein [Haloplanus aerogenes]
MDISEILSTKFTEFDIGTPLSKVAGAFENQELDAVVVTDGDEYRGVVSRRQLASSSNQPSAKVGSQVQHVPTVERTEDVREVARLMIGSDAKTLPVLDGDDRVVGVVTGDAVLEAVRPFLDAVTVDDAYTAELISATPETTIGKALNTLREAGIAHLPVVDGDDLAGMLSLYDVIEFTTRGGSKSQGGSSSSFGGRGGGGQNRGGFGAREGNSDRMLDLPVRNLMSDTVATVERSAPLDGVVETMFEREISSLVVTDDDTNEPVGIITKTDIIEALTWEGDDRNAVQVFGLDLLEGMDYDDVSALIENMTSKYGEMSVIKASIELQEHKEQSRGVPLVLARIRLVTDRGYFTADGEGYGASHALRLAANAVERQLLKGKTYGQSKKHPDTDEQEQLYGWWLGG